MKNRLALYFPPIFFVAVLAMIVWSESRLGTPMDTMTPHESTVEIGAAIDPVCQMEVGTDIVAQHQGQSYFFCSDRCQDMFHDTPDNYLQVVCLVCKSEDVFNPVEVDGAFTATWQDTAYTFCTQAHRDAFNADPAGYFLHSMWGIPAWLYYSSIAFILILSFGIFEWMTPDPEQRAARGFLLPRLGFLKSRIVEGMVQHPATRFLIRLFFVLCFLMVIAAGLFGSQLPANNIAPLLTWTIWWGGLILVILYAGSIWCYVCPWDAIADWAEGLRFWGAKKEGLGLGIKVPKRWQNIWPAIILFIILTWLELGFGVTMNPRMTAWLALAITAAAVMSAFIFERKAFCRYACPVGRIIGIYALFSPVEVRAKDPEACRSCRTQSCFKGNAQGDACPTSLYIPAMRENTNCLTCMECAKSCEKDNVALNARPWGSDLIENHRVRFDEAWLALLLLVLAAFHGLTMTGIWRDLLSMLQDRTGLSHTLTFSGAMLVLMTLPCIIYAVLVRFSFELGNSDTYTYRDYFIRYAYALLPIALFYHLAHNCEHLLMEGQKIIPLLSDPFGWEWDLFGMADMTFAPLINIKTLWFVQVALVVVGHIYSLWVAQGVALAMFPKGRTLRSQLPMLIAMILFSLLSLWLLKQPMEMRSSAM